MAGSARPWARTIWRPCTRQRRISIWFAPQTDAVLEVERLNRSRFQIFYDQAGKLVENMPDPSHVNLPMRAWYYRTGTWNPGSTHAFTTVLLPHDPQCPHQSSPTASTWWSTRRHTPPFGC